MISEKDWVGLVLRMLHLLMAIFFTVLCASVDYSSCSDRENMLVA